MKKTLCLSIILAICLSGFYASAAPSITVSGGSEGRVSINGTATEGSPVTLIVLNDGFTPEDIRENTPGAAQYVKVQKADATGYAFQFTIHNSDGGLYKVYVTADGVQSEGSFEFYSVNAKENLITLINNGSYEQIAAATDRIYRTYGLTNHALYPAAKSDHLAEFLLNFRQELQNERFPADVDAMYQTLREALLLEAYHCSDKTLLVADGKLAFITDIPDLSDSKEYNDYTTSLSASGREALHKSLMSNTYRTTAALKKEFAALVRYHCIKNYREDGFGHVGHFLDRYADEYEADGFEIGEFAKVKNKNTVCSGLIGGNAADLDALAKLFQGLVETELEGNSGAVTGGTSAGGASTGGFSGGVSAGGFSGSVQTGNTGGVAGYVKDTEPPVSNEEKATSNFADVADDFWAKGYIDTLYAANIINGRGDGTFGPDEWVTRQEFAKMTVMAMGADVSGVVCPFEDVDEEWSKPYITAAYDMGIVGGISDTAFAPHDGITREQAATMIYRALTYLGMVFTEDTSMFADDDLISAYARTPVYALKASGILAGKDNNLFFPPDNLTRAEAAKLICAMYEMR